MRRIHYYTPIILQKIGYILFFLIYKLFVSIEIRGKEHLDSLSEPIIIATNHTSELDATAIPLVLPFFSKFFPIYFVTNSEDKYRTFGWRGYLYGGVFFNMLGGYSVYSGNKNYAIALADHVDILKHGHAICIFPEGKRTRDGILNPARGGLGYLVHTTGAVVVPVAIDTFFNISLWDFLTCQRKVVITICKPMTRDELVSTSHPTVEDYRSVGQKVLERIDEVME
jgi:1-acyl-sn-glycerol-3-phosphate acyltransferase